MVEQTPSLPYLHQYWSMMNLSSSLSLSTILIYLHYRWFPILPMRHLMHPRLNKRRRWRRNNWIVNGMLSLLFNSVSPSFSLSMPFCVTIYSPFSWWAIIFVMLPLLPCIFLTVSTNILLGLCMYCICLCYYDDDHYYCHNHYLSIICQLFFNLTIQF